jgi:hypothetical protein
MSSNGKQDSFYLTPTKTYFHLQLVKFFMEWQTGGGLARLKQSILELSSFPSAFHDVDRFTAPKDGH